MPGNYNLERFTIQDIKNKIQNGELDLRDIVSEYLATINKHAELNAFLHVYNEEALAKADEIQSKIKAGRAGSLAGAIVAVKDNIAMKGGQLTCASNILGNFVSPYDSTVATKLRNADAIIIGKTNMDEFAMGSSGENSSVAAAKILTIRNMFPGAPLLVLLSLLRQICVM